MSNDARQFAAELEKIRSRAANREYNPPPQHKAQLVFRADQAPHEVNVDDWANTLFQIQHLLNVPLTVSGGGYGCFTVSVTTDLSHVSRFVAGIEENQLLQGCLNKICARVIELWRFAGEKSQLELLVPREMYDLIVATNRKSQNPLKPSDRVDVDTFSREHDGALTLGRIRVGIYDPRVDGSSPGILRRIWRKVSAPIRYTTSIQVDFADLEVCHFPGLFDSLFSSAGVDSPPLRFLIFVHGYATPLRQAVNAVGRLIHNLRCNQISTIPILFAWPSYGSPVAFFSDNDRAALSEKPLDSLLAEISAHKDRRSIVDLLAHSHGGQLVLRTLVASAALPKNGRGLRNTILVAPEIDNGLFNQRLNELKLRSNNITIYHSKGDLPLMISEIFKLSRAGRSPNVVGGEILDKLDIIDASFLNADWFGHSYHVGCPEMHEDIRGLLDGIPASKRRMLKSDTDQVGFYRLSPYQ